MGKGGSTPGPSPEVSQGISNAENALASLVRQETGQSQQLFNLTEPGLVQAEQYYQQLMSGDPGAIMRAIAPAAGQVASAAAGARSNITANAAPGGEKNLALDMVDVNRGSSIASLASGTVASAPQSLGTMAGQGISAAQAGEGLAGSSLSSEISGWTGLGNLEVQGQQIAAEQKGSKLGAESSAAGTAGEVAMVAMMCPCRGSMILMESGIETPVECMRIGDRVVGYYGDIQTVESITSVVLPAIEVVTSAARTLSNSLSHTFISDDDEFAVAFESVGRLVWSGNPASLMPESVTDVRFVGDREVFCFRTDGSHSYRADGVWALGVGDEASDRYLEQPDTMKRMMSVTR